MQHSFFELEFSDVQIVFLYCVGMASCDKQRQDSTECSTQLSMHTFVQHALHVEMLTACTMRLGVSFAVSFAWYKYQRQAAADRVQIGQT